MPEVLLVAVGLAVAAVFVLAPLRAPRQDEAATVDEASALRHRVALEALRDVEADYRAGSLDEAGYERQRAEAEARAAATGSALREPTAEAGRSVRRGARLPAIVAGGAIAAVLVIGASLPATGIPNGTVVDEALAASRDREAARQAEIDELLEALAEDPSDPATLSDLADAYLAGTSDSDLQRAAVALQALIGLEPERGDAYERIIAAYLRAGDATNARLAHDAYAELDTADQIEVAFLDGLIALRGEGDGGRAAAAFDRFLDLAPDDPRAAMVRALRDEAAGD
jgi:cytochrome c-type biogenesis protein CcmI